MALFAEHGYDAISTASVAQTAGVSQMTLFRHFPTKADLVLQDPFDPLIAGFVRTRPPGESPVRAVAEGIRQAWCDVDAQVAGALRTRLSIIAGSASLLAAMTTSTQATAEAISLALTDRGIDPDSAQVAAAAALSGLTAALLQWARTADADLPSVLHRALDVLGGRAGTGPVARVTAPVGDAGAGGQ